MIGTATAPDSGIEPASWERFEALYRASRDDVFAYVATLLRDRGAAEDVTELAFERAYRRRRLATLIADPEDCASEPVADGAEVALARTMVRQALSKLPAPSAASPTRGRCARRCSSSSPARLRHSR